MWIRSGRLSRTCIGLLSAMVLAATPLQSAGASRDEEERQVLGFNNVIKGTTASVISVRLPAPATIRDPFFGGSDFKVKGKGEFVGFAIAQAPFVSGESGVVIAGRIPPRSGTSDTVFSGIGFGDAPSGTVRLPAGDYSVFLLAEGKPVTATFKLHGLEGHTTLRPQKKADFDLRSPTPDIGSELQQNVYSAGAHETLRTDGLLFDVLWFRRQAHVHSQHVFCYTEGRPKPAEHPAPYAGCQTQNNRYIPMTGETFVTPERHLVYHFGGATVPKGTYGQGFASVSAGLIEDLGYMAVWLGLQ